MHFYWVFSTSLVDVLKWLKVLTRLTAENMWRFHSVIPLNKLLVAGHPESLRGKVVTHGGIHDRRHVTRHTGDQEVPAVRRVRPSAALVLSGVNV